MQLYTVGTGSFGNCYLLKRDNNKIIALDCGCKWRDVLIGCNFRPIDIELALVTHSHNDHARFPKKSIRKEIPQSFPLKSLMMSKTMDT